MLQQVVWTKPRGTYYKNYLNLRLQLKIPFSALKKKASDLAFPLPAHDVVLRAQDHLVPPAGLWLSPALSAGSPAGALPPSALPAATAVTQPT